MNHILDKYYPNNQVIIDYDYDRQLKLKYIWDMKNYEKVPLKDTIPTREEWNALWT